MDQAPLHIHGSRHMSLTFLLCLAGLLAACGAPGAASSTPRTNAAATVTPNATATAAAQPVLIQLSATSSGTITANTLQLTVTTVVINQTGQTIHLSYYPNLDCVPTPPLILSLVDSSGKQVWDERQTFISNGCTNLGYYDVGGIPPISPGGSRTWTRTISLQYQLEHNVISLSPGTYTLAAHGLFWHEGTVNSDGTSSSPHGYSSGSTTVTLQ